MKTVYSFILKRPITHCVYYIIILYHTHDEHNNIIIWLSEY